MVIQRVKKNDNMDQLLALVHKTWGKKCASCDGVPRFMCGGSVCEGQLYCGVECQRKHWTTHQYMCIAGKMKRERSDDDDEPHQDERQHTKREKDGDYEPQLEEISSDDLLKQSDVWGLIASWLSIDDVKSLSSVDKALLRAI